MDWGQVAQGAVGGAGAGAALGPWGAAGGAAIGGLAGFFGARQRSKEEERAANLRAQAAAELEAFSQERLGTQSAQAGDSSFRGGQEGLVSLLQAQAAGRGPSAAQSQLQAATAANTKMQLGMATGARNSPLAGVMAARNIAGLNQEAANQSAQIRAQEQLAATGQLGSALGQFRSQDLNLSQFNAQQQNAYAQAQNQLALEALRAKLGITTPALQQQQQGPGMGSQLLALGGSAFMDYMGQRNTPRASTATAPAAGGGYDLYGSASKGLAGRFGKGG